MLLHHRVVKRKTALRRSDGYTLDGCQGRRHGHSFPFVASGSERSNNPIPTTNACVSSCSPEEEIWVYN